MPLTTPSLGFAFATTTPHGLTSRHAADSQAHSSKGTPSHTRGALTDCKHMVSGTISLPSRGTFHHSLTVLSAIGHTEYLGLPGGPGRFTADFTSPLLLGKNTNTHHKLLTYGTLTHSGRPSQTTSAQLRGNARRGDSPTKMHPTTPHAQPLSGITHTRFSLIHVRSPLLAESLFIFLSCGY